MVRPPRHTTDALRLCRRFPGWSRGAALRRALGGRAGAARAAREQTAAGRAAGGGPCGPSRTHSGCRPHGPARAAGQPEVWFTTRLHPPPPPPPPPREPRANPSDSEPASGLLSCRWIVPVTRTRLRCDAVSGSSAADSEPRSQSSLNPSPPGSQSQCLGLDPTDPPRPRRAGAGPGSSTTPNRSSARGAAARRDVGPLRVPRPRVRRAGFRVTVSGNSPLAAESRSSRGLRRHGPGPVGAPQH